MINFIDKDYLLNKLLENVVMKKSLYFISGAHGIGKTTLVTQLIDKVEKKSELSERIFFVSIELYEDAYLKSLEDIKNSLNISDEIILEIGNQEELTDVESRKQMIEKGIAQKEAENKHVVLVLDEFQNIKSCPELIGDLFQWFGDSDSREGISIIFIARPGYNSSYFQFFRDNIKSKKHRDILDSNQRGLRGFNEKDRDKYLELYFEKKDYLMDKAKKTLTYYGGGHPFSLSQILEQIARNEKYISTIRIPLGNIDNRCEQLHSGMKDTKIEQKDFLQLFLEAFTNSGYSEDVRLRNAQYLEEYGFAVINESEKYGIKKWYHRFIDIFHGKSKCKYEKMFRLEDGSILPDVSEALRNDLKYLTIDVYEPITPYLVEYCIKKRNIELQDLKKNIDALEDKIRKFLQAKLEERYGSKELVEMYVEKRFKNKMLYMDTARSEAVITQDKQDVNVNAIEVLGFYDYMIIMRDHWEQNKPYFTELKEYDKMFGGWIRDTAKHVKDNWYKFSDEEKNKYRRVSFARARNTFAHKTNIEEKEIFSQEQLEQLKKDIKAAISDIDEGKALAGCTFKGMYYKREELTKSN